MASDDSKKHEDEQLSPPTVLMKEFVELLTNLFCGSINITNQEYGSKNLQSKPSMQNSASQSNLKREVSGHISDL